MYCKNCGEGNEIENENINHNTTQNNLHSLLNTLSFINVFIMIFYTFSKEAGNLGVLLAFIVGPFLMLPQALLITMDFFKKTNFILNIIFIFGALISTILTLNMFNYKINTFIILNIILLIIIFANLLINNNKNKVKK